MGDLPLPGPTLGQVPIMAAPDPNNYSPATALQQLEGAYQKGIIGQDEIQDLIARAGQRSVATAQNQTAIKAAPSATAAAIAGNQASAAQSQATIQALPSATTAAIAGSQASQAQSESATALTKLQTQLNSANLQASLAPAQLAAAEAKIDPTGSVTYRRMLVQNANLHEPLPTKPDGTLDYTAIDRRYDELLGVGQNPGATPPTIQPAATPGAHGGVPIAPAAQPAASSSPTIPFSGAGAMSPIAASTLYAPMWASPTGQSIKALAMAKNRPDLAVDVNNPYEVYQQLQNAPTALTGQDAVDARNDYNNNIFPQRQQLNQLTQLVNTPGIVGPEVGSGDAVGEKFADLKAWAGLDPTKAATQAQVQQAISTQMKNVMATVHNIRNQREFNVIADSIPKMNDTPQVWNQWIERTQGVLDRQAQSYKDFLAPADAAHLTPLPVPATPPVPAGATAAPVVPTTQAQINALPVGSRYTINGVTYTRGQ